jgi:hypothetical protein
MENIYDSMISAVREHWKANNNAYPQRFELTQSTLDGLLADRRLVNETMNYPLNLKNGYEKEFLGVPVTVSSEGNALIALDGTRVSLGFGA